MTDFIGPHIPLFRLTQEERAVIMNANPPEIDLHDMHFCIEWSWLGCGFGQLYFSKDGDKMIIDGEGMSKERLRMLLYAFVDNILENSEID